MEEISLWSSFGNKATWLYLHINVLNVRLAHENDKIIGLWTKTKWLMYNKSFKTFTMLQ